MKQWRVVYRHPGAGFAGACFIDDDDEAEARSFFAKAFPSAVLLSINLEPVKPCAAYERREKKP